MIFGALMLRTLGGSRGLEVKGLRGGERLGLGPVVGTAHPTYGLQLARKSGPDFGEFSLKCSMVQIWLFPLVAGLLDESGEAVEFGGREFSGGGGEVGGDGFFEGAFEEGFEDAVEGGLGGAGAGLGG